MEDIEDIMESFKEDYKENPRGWSFWTDKSDEFYDIYILNEEKGYFIKVDSIYNQNPLGMGTEINVEKDQFEKKLPDFGFRRFRKDELENFVKALSKSEDTNKKKKLFEKEMREKPTLTGKPDKKDYVMVGPFNQGKPFQYSLEEQEEADKKLKQKLKSKFRKKYKMYR